MAAPERFLVWGGGGHGKVVADLVRALGHEVAGYADADPRKLGRVVEPGGARVVATQEQLLASIRERGEYLECADALALAVGDNRVRWACLEAVGALPVPPLVHPSAVVSPSARIGSGTVVFAGAVINADARIGRGVIVNTGSIVEHDCVVEDGVHLSPAATLCGGVRVGARSWVCAGSTVIPGVSVGADAVLGAGAVVLRDVPDGAKVVGNPGRIVTGKG